MASGLLMTTIRTGPLASMSSDGAKGFSDTSHLSELTSWSPGKTQETFRDHVAQDLACASLEGVRGRVARRSGRPAGKHRLQTEAPPRERRHVLLELRAEDLGRDREP